MSCILLQQMRSSTAICSLAAHAIQVHASSTVEALAQPPSDASPTPAAQSTLLLGKAGAPLSRSSEAGLQEQLQRATSAAPAGTAVHKDTGGKAPSSPPQPADPKTAAELVAAARAATPGLAFLDLRVHPPRAGADLVSAGPAACLAGELSLLPGMFGLPAQVAKPNPNLNLNINLNPPTLSINLAFFNTTYGLHPELQCTSAESMLCSQARGMLLLQVLFKLPPSAAQQLVAFSAPAGAYEALRAPHALQAAQLTLTLPGPAALAALSLAPRGQALNGPTALAQQADTLPDPPQPPQGPANGDAFADMAQQGAEQASLQQRAPAEAPVLLGGQASADSECGAAAPVQGLTLARTLGESAPPSPVRALARDLGRAPGSPRSPSGRRVAAIVDEWPPLPPPASLRQLWAQYQAGALPARACVMTLPWKRSLRYPLYDVPYTYLLHCVPLRTSQPRPVAWHALGLVQGTCAAGIHSMP